MSFHIHRVKTSKQAMFVVLVLLDKTERRAQLTRWTPDGQTTILKDVPLTIPLDKDARRDIVLGWFEQLAEYLCSNPTATLDDAQTEVRIRSKAEREQDAAVARG